MVGLLKAIGFTQDKSENGERSGGGFRSKRDSMVKYCFTWVNMVEMDVNVKPQCLAPSTAAYCCLNLWIRVNTNTEAEQDTYTLATSTATLCLIPARVFRFQAAPSITDDGIDGHNLDLTRVLEGLDAYFGFGLGIALEHPRGGRGGELR